MGVCERECVFSVYFCFLEKNNWLGVLWVLKLRMLWNWVRLKCVIIVVYLPKVFD